MAMEELGIRVVGEEPNRDVITGIANAHDIRTTGLYEELPTLRA
jgi:hypothetical protein